MHPRNEIAIAYQAVFDGNDHAEIVRKDLESYCFKNKETTAKDKTGHVDPLGTMFNNGKRSVGLRIQLMLSTDPNKPVQKEA